MKEEYIPTSLGNDFEVYESSIPTDIPEGKTPIRGVGLTITKSNSLKSKYSLYEKIYDKVLFIDTDQLSCSYEGIQQIIGDKMMKLKRCRVASSWGLLKVRFNVFNIEENKWEGWSARQGTK